ncbi:cobalt-precorrin-6A reductase [Brooklawnia cerclae]|uniref:Precorrin-6A/cobalt-precorrin-6A reductase n=1 Tax=Brooklawnia cerclae TaxID=349934 RepID=A0ABX0SMQ4_9ACTN|nr:cobalt-precorrin-6A reductase [Brooklawnia cerclae]NIH58320.1 precorrin-6A/cobalt-precorrin-6A reductase [Brooklawnia cerclae]
MDVLILGGTGRARELASTLVSRGLDVTSSLAGRTRDQPVVAGDVRVGGFGGTDGLAGWLAANRPGCVVNAAHSFAGTMTRHAAEACLATGVPLARFEPPSWQARPESSGWTWVGDHDQAAAAVARLPGPVLLTVGRQPLGHYLGLASRAVTARAVDAPDIDLPPAWELVLARGPFRLDDELRLLREHEVSVLVAKDSGGDELDARLRAAGSLGVRVVMVRRPDSPHGVPLFGDLRSVVNWVGTHPSSLETTA